MITTADDTIDIGCAPGPNTHRVIAGDNLPVMRRMAENGPDGMAGAVDCVYLDPPYNTGATDWDYRNSFDGDEWSGFMRSRLKTARELLNPDRSTLIATIDEKQYLQLGMLLHEVFPDADIQMVTSVTNPRGSSRKGRFARTDEYIFFVLIGDATITPVRLGPEWDKSAHTAQRKGAYWRGMVRRGEHELRADRPAMFYPVFVDPDTLKVHSIGDPLGPGDDASDVAPPAGTVTVWPTTTAGSEGRWRVGVDTARDYLARKYLGAAKSRYSKGEFYIHYLSPGEQRKITSGDYRVVGTRHNGTVDIEVVGRAPAVPGTTWNVTSHDAGRYGTKLLGKLLPGVRFPYAKSLHAVEDCLRFVIGNDTDALVVDPFGGSGTTAHAVARLNQEDGGHRSTVTITANELSAGDEAELIANGYCPGDEEWDNRGIFHRVTVPRIEAALFGTTPDGTPISGNYEHGMGRLLSDGLPEALEVFRARANSRA